MEQDERFPYEDILHLPRHVSEVHPRMPAAQRAAQFSPFAALTGYGDAIAETGRLTEARAELGEDEKARLDERLRLLRECLPQRPEAVITHFVPDEKKSGGAYVASAGTVLKLDDLTRRVVLQGGESIAFDDIYAIEGALFESPFSEDGPT